MTKKQRTKTAIETMMDKIRNAVAECGEAGVGEMACYEALTEEADGWQMRLDELKEEARDAH